MSQSFQAPVRIGAKELADAEAAVRDVVGAYRHMSLDEAKAKVPGPLDHDAEYQEGGLIVQNYTQITAAKPKGTTDHDGDGKMGGVKGKKPRVKR